MAIAFKCNQRAQLLLNVINVPHLYINIQLAYSVHQWQAAQTRPLYCKMYWEKSGRGAPQFPSFVKLLVKFIEIKLLFAIFIVLGIFKNRKFA